MRNGEQVEEWWMVQGRFQKSSRVLCRGPPRRQPLFLQEIPFGAFPFSETASGILTRGSHNISETQMLVHVTPGWTFIILHPKPKSWRPPCSDGRRRRRRRRVPPKRGQEYVRGHIRTYFGLIMDLLWTYQFRIHVLDFLCNNLWILGTY